MSFHGGRNGRGKGSHVGGGGGTLRPLSILYATNANDVATIDVVEYLPPSTTSSSSSNSSENCGPGEDPFSRFARRVQTPQSSECSSSHAGFSIDSHRMKSPESQDSSSKLLRRGSTSESLLSHYFYPDYDLAARPAYYQHHMKPGPKSPANIVEKNDKINPRAANDVYSLPGSLSGTPSGESSKASSREEAGTRYSSTAGYFLNPYSWETVDGNPEPDDYLHDPEAAEVQKRPLMRAVFATRALLNLGMLAFLATSLLTLFGGYPILAHFTRPHETTKGAFNLGGTNASGQVASIPGMRTGLIDPDTPIEARTIRGLDGRTKMQLVFSDEFNANGRSFYPGDDPFWEALDLHYWATNNFEWYTGDAVTTRNGALEITLDQVETHNLNFRSGMLSTWNKFCFTGGFLVASVQLPGSANVPGLWPAFWTMGNLGRAGYGASVEGNWPYSYESCDVGTLMNQTDAEGNPQAAQTGGDVMWNRKKHAKVLSFLPGQRLSACTCPDEDHPGPKLKDGTWKGRSAPEIDVFEAQVDSSLGMTVSQSLQAAPFNWMYNVTNTTGPAFEFYRNGSHRNLYSGENTQQALSGISMASQKAMQRGGDGSFAEYGFEYQPGYDGYVEWVADGQPAWKLFPAALDPDPVAEISRRPVPNEPLYLILNLGISENFGLPEWSKLEWPAVMKVDWVRVYQPEGKTNVGCDPEDYPTAAYIERHKAAYYNANYSLWGNSPAEGGYGAVWPRNRLYPGGCDAPTSTYPGTPSKTVPKAPLFPTESIAVGQN